MTTVPTSYTELQLDALREVANIGSGTASTALAALLARPVDISVPTVRVLDLPAALDAVGDDTEITAVAVAVAGDIPAVMVAVFTPDHGARLAELLGVADDADVARSALAEVGNILATHYLTSLHQMTGLAFEPGPPRIACGDLGAIVARAVVEGLGVAGPCLLIDSELEVEGEPCSLSFLYIPGARGADDLLSRLGAS